MHMRAKGDDRSRRRGKGLQVNNNLPWIDSGHRKIEQDSRFRGLTDFDAGKKRRRGGGSFHRCAKLRRDSGDARGKDKVAG